MTDAAAIPRPVETGREMLMLERFHRDVTW